MEICAFVVSIYGVYYPYQFWLHTPHTNSQPQIFWLLNFYEKFVCLNLQTLQ